MHPATKEIMKTFSENDIDDFIAQIKELQNLTPIKPEYVSGSTYDFWLDNTCMSLVNFASHFGAKLHKIAKFSDQYDM